MYAKNCNFYIAQVLLQKDCKKWNWDVISTLIYGPLRLPSRLHEALKTKIVKRVIRMFKIIIIIVKRLLQTKKEAIQWLAIQGTILQVYKLCLSPDRKFTFHRIWLHLFESIQVAARNSRSATDWIAKEPRAESKSTHDRRKSGTFFYTC